MDDGQVNAAKVVCCVLESGDMATEQREKQHRCREKEGNCHCWQRRLAADYLCDVCMGRSVDTTGVGQEDKEKERCWTVASRVLSLKPSKK
jgi:hypothetical protein